MGRYNCQRVDGAIVCGAKGPPSPPDLLEVAYFQAMLNGGGICWLTEEDARLAAHVGAQ